ncbi:MAG: VOC family protein [Myxococcota bacterium]|nr:VOC family protein [Myxococcota bacterium]
MPAPTTGRFVWHELHTSDRPKAAKFYTQLIGWETKDVPMGPGEPYTLCQRESKDVAGITKSMAPANVPPHWLPYIAVADVDASAGKVKELGGKILMEPTDIPNIGRFAAVADPQGAAFAIYKGTSPYSEEPERPPVGTFCWEELSTNDPQAAAKFYSAAFGYTVEEVPMGATGTYRILKRGDRQTAGITKTMPGAPPHPHWLSYLAVKNVDESTKNAKELGAQVHVPPTDIPKIGRFGVVGDPTGAAIALFTGSM